ncbi:MAG: spore coat U domain-containing protein [Candidatus Korobacteraceae bacterium]
MNRFAKVFLITMAVMLVATTAFATNKTANIAVTANINPACTISASAMAFGTYDPLGVNKTVELDHTSIVTVQCVDELPAVITLDEGLYKASGSTPTTPQRQMQCLDMDGEFLSYFLYQDASHSQVWGANANALSITADGASHDYTVYGVIPPGQVQEDGGWADTVVATVSY